MSKVKPLAEPNLPTSSVRLAAVSVASPQAIEGLERQGIEVVAVEEVDKLPPPVATHSDLQLLHLGSDLVILAQESAYLEHTLGQHGFSIKFLTVELGNKYPQDISLNFLLLKKYCFGLKRNMPLQLEKHCIDAGLQIIDCKQGYARCSVAVVSPCAAMTADPTMYQLLSGAGFDVLRLDFGDIKLPGYDTGFIGGCCGLIDKDRLAFAGSLEQYPQRNHVQAFLHKHHVKPVELWDGPLCDIGGILPLMEEA